MIAKDKVTKEYSYSNKKKIGERTLTIKEFVQKSDKLNCKEYRSLLNEKFKNAKTSIIKHIIEFLLISELDIFLENTSDDNSIKKNTKNGYSAKKINFSSGRVEIKIPRDRMGKFVPNLIEKYHTDVSDIENYILLLFSYDNSESFKKTILKKIYPELAKTKFIDKILDRVSKYVDIWYKKKRRRKCSILIYKKIELAKSDNLLEDELAVFLVAASSSGKSETLCIWKMKKEFLLSDEFIEKIKSIAQSEVSFLKKNMGKEFAKKLQTKQKNTKVILSNEI